MTDPPSRTTAPAENGRWSPPPRCPRARRETGSRSAERPCLRGLASGLRVSLRKQDQGLDPRGGLRSAPTWSGAGVSVHKLLDTDACCTRRQAAQAGLGSPLPPIVPSTLLGALAIAAFSRPAASGGGQLPPGAHPDSRRGPQPWRGDHGGRGWGHVVQQTISSARSGTLLIGFLYQQMDCEHRQLHLLKDAINLGEKREAAGGYQHTAPVKGPPQSISGINSSFIRARSGLCDLWQQPISHYRLEEKKTSRPQSTTQICFLKMVSHYLKCCSQR